MTPSSAQDRHLDALLAMALEQLEQEENESIETTADPQVDASIAIRLDQAYEAARQTANREKRRIRKKVWKQKTARRLRLAAAVIAVLFAAALAAFPAALAASAEFRGRVMQLFIEIDRKEGAASFSFLPQDPSSPDSGEAPGGPERWQGMYFPRYIPEGFALASYSSAPRAVVYASPSGQRFTFTESMGSMPPADPPEGSFFMLEYLQGGDFPVIEEHTENGSRVTVTWEMGGRWLRLVTENMDREEALRLADSTAADTGKNDINVNEPLPQSSLISTSVPDWWMGAYYPSYLPPDMWIEAFTADDSVKYEGPREAFIQYYERNDASAGAFMTSPELESQYVLIGEAEGTMLTADHPDGPYIILLWKKRDTLLELHTNKISREEALCVAESVIPCRAPEEPTAYPALSRDAGGRALPPEEWTGQFFPADIPEGFCLRAMELSSRTISLIHPQNNLRLVFQEHLLFPPCMPALEAAGDVRLADVGGRKALMITQQAEDSASQHLSLYWEVSPEQWITLEALDVPEEILLQIAGSVQRLPSSPGMDAPPPEHTD